MSKGTGEFTESLPLVAIAREPGERFGSERLRALTIDAAGLVDVRFFFMEPL
jgi:hypothetical protein